jgi:3-phenylpropionate/trans-cinnamate dioxygenase ferredoxin reductase subunit
MSRDVVVVGASLAGATVAATLRELGHDGRITLVGDEAELPYERPPLSKELLLGTKQAADLLVRPAADYAELGVELRLGTAATGLDVAARRVTLADGRTIPYDDLVIATGAANLRPPLPGMDLPGVHQLRTLDDAVALRERAGTGSRAVVVGMGFLGCEISAALRQLGLAVTMVDTLAGPLLGQLGPLLSDRVRSWHEEHGVVLLPRRSVTAILQRGAALAVRTSAGDELAADLVVVGVGARPVIGWLLDSGVALGDGVLVDANGRTNVPGVHAAGDVAAVWDEKAGAHRRTEHWNGAVEQGRRVAHAICGEAPPAPEAPYFWSAQYGHYLQHVGVHPATSRLVLRESAGRLTACFLDDGVLAAVVTVDNGKDLRAARALLGTAPDAAALADPAVPLRSLVPARSPA